MILCKSCIPSKLFTGLMILGKICIPSKLFTRLMILGKSCIPSKLFTANLSVITSLFVLKKSKEKNVFVQRT